ncbi:MAG: hypothetical protein GX312_05165 [Candidatus Phytoplasma sp.]|nr:hypothetical protein [Phytoplasma sp.]
MREQDIKNAGFINYSLCVMFVVLTVLLVLFSMTLKEISFTKTLVEDGLMASNLASAVIDIDEYGTTNNIVITDTIHAYTVFLNALKDNLGLDNNLKPYNDRVIVEPVEVEKYIIYNVVGNDVHVTEYRYGVKQAEITHTGAAGKMYTPDSVLITDTTIYSKIKLKLNGLLDSIVNVTKEKSVDITIS